MNIALPLWATKLPNKAVFLASKLLPLRLYYSAPAREWLLPRRPPLLQCPLLKVSAKHHLNQCKKNPKVRLVTKDDVQLVISLVKDVDIEELQSDIVLQVIAEFFLVVCGTSMTLEISMCMHKNVIIAACLQQSRTVLVKLRHSFAARTVLI